MKILIDTNIFISAILFPDGRAAAALERALLPPFQPLTCDYVIDEIRNKFQEKFPYRAMELDAFMYSIMSVINVVETPSEEMEAEKLIRDKKDRPILRAALLANAELLLTGDKDFLESPVTRPRIVSVSDFLTGY